MAHTIRAAHPQAPAGGPAAASSCHPVPASVPAFASAAHADEAGQGVGSFPLLLIAA